MNYCSIMYEIEVYTAENGSQPFSEWLEGLRDKRVKAKIIARLTRASLGNFGDWKSLSNAAGLCEMREHSGSGFRIYYHLENQKIVLVLAGSTKAEQAKAIKKAVEFYHDYKRRGL